MTADSETVRRTCGDPGNPRTPEPELRQYLIATVTDPLKPGAGTQRGSGLA